MAEIDDLMRAAFGRAALAADAAVDLASARQTVRGRIAAGEAGPRLEVAPGWRLVRWGFAAHRVAWTALLTAVAVAVAVLVIAGVRGAAPVAPGGPGTGMTTPPQVSEPGPGSAAPATSSTAPVLATMTASSSMSETTTTEPAVTTVPTTASSAPPPTTASSSVPTSAPTSPAPPRRTTTPAPPRTTAPATTRTSSAPPISTPPVTTAPSSTAATASTTTAATTTSSPAPDTDPPVILSLFATAQEVTPGQTVSIVVQVTDDVGVTGVRLAWSGKEDGLPEGAAEMTPSQTGWVFTVTVPKLDRGGTVVFTATARDAAGNRSEQAAVAVVIRI